jgi:hypothetical protein
VKAEKGCVEGREAGSELREREATEDLGRWAGEGEGGVQGEPNLETCEN